MADGGASETKSTNPKDLIGMTKPPLRLVPAALMLHVSQAMADGAVKYGPYNWREHPVRLTVYVEAAMRHLLSLLDGEDRARDSKHLHAAHVGACMGIILDALETGNLIDDRATPGPAGDLIEKLTKKPTAQPSAYSESDSSFGGLVCELKTTPAPKDQVFETFRFSIVPPQVEPDPFPSLPPVLDPALASKPAWKPEEGELVEINATGSIACRNGQRGYVTYTKSYLPGALVVDLIAEPGKTGGSAGPYDAKDLRRATVRVGDRVRVTDKAKTLGIPVGTEGVVLVVNSDHPAGFYQTRFDVADQWGDNVRWAFGDELTLLPAQSTFNPGDRVRVIANVNDEEPEMDVHIGKSGVVIRTDGFNYDDYPIDVELDGDDFVCFKAEELAHASGAV